MVCPVFFLDWKSQKKEGIGRLAVGNYVCDQYVVTRQSRAVEHMSYRSRKTVYLFGGKGSRHIISTIGV